MKIDQVGVQLYTLRNFCKTAVEYAATLKQVRKIGYRAIQISAVGPIPPEDLRRIAEGEGLTIAATHEPGAVILSEPQKVVERLGILGCRYTAYPGPVIPMDDLGQVEQLIAQLDAAGEVLQKAGQVLAYHNHSQEFYRLVGKTVLERIYENTKPEHLQGELDTYWVQAGGGDSAKWCRRLKGRLPLLHIKDYAVDPMRVPYYAEIGHGNLDFPEIIAAAEESGCEWFIVEQDICPGSPFDSLRKSFDYIRDHLIS